MHEQAGYKFEFTKFLAWLPVYLLIGFALYVLSTGPFYWAIYEAYFLQSSTYLAALYLPLVWLSHVSPGFAGWMDWYIGLWIL
ncbi:MAG: hypothetical protein H0T47_03410 [Planctomycetaceae bacterium]|nr:hypothetical protein [Planctomycetaceae bacterium]